MIRLYTIIILIMLTLQVNAQKELEVTGTYSLIMEEDMTLATAKRKVIEGAKSEAIKKAFGTMVIGNQLIQTNEVNGIEKSSFSENTQEVAKGDWLGDTKNAEIDIKYNNGNLILYAQVWGIAREISQAKMDVEWNVLNHPYANSKTDTFNNGDNVFVSFKAPDSGYLAIYLLDTKDASCLLPYNTISSGVYKIEGGKEYILFDPAHDINCKGKYKLSTKQSVETNEIVLVFSPNTFSKAIDNKAGINKANTLNIMDFQKWLLKAQQDDRNMFVEKKVIKIINLE